LVPQLADVQTHVAEYLGNGVGHTVAGRLDKRVAHLDSVVGEVGHELGNVLRADRPTEDVSGARMHHLPQPLASEHSLSLQVRDQRRRNQEAIRPHSLPPRRTRQQNPPREP